MKKKIILFVFLVVIVPGVIGYLATSYIIQLNPPPVKIVYKTTLPELPLQKWVLSQSSRCSPKQVKLIIQECIRTDLPLLILALISAESEFNPTAVSSKGAIGLGQIMFEHHMKALIGANIIKEKRDLFDVEANIQATHFILKMFLRQSNGDVTKALERYLGGHDGAYQRKILNNLANLYVVTSRKEEGK